MGATKLGRSPETRRERVARDLAPVALEEVAAKLDIDLTPSSTVEIDDHSIGIVAKRLIALSEVSHPVAAKWDDALFWNVESSRSERSQYFAVGNSINFRFWDLADRSVRPAKGSINGKEFRGSMYMWRCLRRCLDEGTHPILEAEFLRNLTDQQFDEVFLDDAGTNPLQIARADRIDNLRDLGRKLGEDWGGQFWNLLQSSNHSIVTFAKLSRTLRAYDDPLCKLTMVNAILHSGSGTYSFSNSPLPGIDYEIVKQLLRQSILRPMGEIRRKLIDFELLTSEEAYELRRSALHAVISLSNETHLSGDLLDNRYWLNRVNCVELIPACQRPGERDRCPFWGACTEDVQFHRPLELTRYY